MNLVRDNRLKKVLSKDVARAAFKGLKRRENLIIKMGVLLFSKLDKILSRSNTDLKWIFFCKKRVEASAIEENKTDWS